MHFLATTSGHNQGVRPHDLSRYVLARRSNSARRLAFRYALAVMRNLRTRFTKKLAGHLVWLT
jgi:hypothetical protein